MSTPSIPPSSGGPPGPPGPQGQPGTAGNPGLIFGVAAPTAGVGVNGQAYIATATLGIYTKSDGAWTLIGYLSGAPGAVGPAASFYATQFIPLVA